MKSLSFIAFLLLGFQNSNAQLFTFNFNGAGTCPAQGSTLAQQPANATVSAVSLTGLSCSSTNDVFNTSGYSANASVNSSQYIEIAITAATGYKINLNSINMVTLRSSNGPTSSRIAHDGGTGIFSSTYDYTAATTASTMNWDFADFSSVSGGTVKFRIYGWAATSTSGTMRIDDLSLLATVTGDTIAANNWKLNGNTAGSVKTLGTLDSVDLPVVTGNHERLRISASSGNLLVGTTTDIPAALVNITSLTKGFLTPRMTTVQRNAIAAPVQGLEIYNTTTNTKDIYNGSSWVSLTGGVQGGLTLQQVTTAGSSTSDTIFVGGLKSVRDVEINGVTVGKGANSVAGNIVVGKGTLSNNTSGGNNIGIGDSILTGNTTGSGNIAIGRASLFTNTTGSNKVAIGAQAGFNSNGNGNVFIGNQAGFNETGNDKLYIANSNTATPLIGGDFSTGNVGIGTTASPAQKLEVNGNVKATGLIIPTGAATGKVWTSDAGGTGSWQASAGGGGNGNDDSKWIRRYGNIYSVDTAKVGIGVDTARAKFHVKGSIRFDSFKNNQSLDSLLTTDTSGKVQFVYRPFGSGGGGGAVYDFRNGLLQTNGAVSLGGQLDDSVKINLGNNSFNLVNGNERLFAVNAAGNMGVGGFASGTYKLLVSGDMSLGQVQETAGYGNKLWFNGNGNNDNIWMSRFNNSTGNSDLRVNIGNGTGSTDQFSVGFDNSGTWTPAFMVQNNGQAGIATTQLTSALSVGTVHGVKLSVGNTGWARTALLQTGNDNNSNGDYTDILVPGQNNNSALLRINSKGNVGIGTALLTPLDSLYKLSVNGKIKAKGLRVQTTGWADFVFEPGYKLRSISEVNEYIKLQRKLPEMPSADEVTREGNDVGETQVKLLQKIEELTLYIIQQEEKIKLLENKIDNVAEIKKQLDELKKMLSHK